MIVSIPLFLGAGYMFIFTFLPYVYPFIIFLIGLYLFFKGALRYLRNPHKSPGWPMVQNFHFLWLNTDEIE